MIPRRVLNQSVTVERFVAATVAPLRNALNEVNGAWGTVSDGVPMRIEGLVGGREVTERKQVVLMTHLGICQAGVDVTEKDRIVDEGSLVYEVQAVNRTPGGVSGHHYELALLELRV